MHFILSSGNAVFFFNFSLKNWFFCPPLSTMLIVILQISGFDTCIVIYYSVDIALSNR